MRIALIGYGQMGKEIEKIAINRGNTVDLIIDVNNKSDLNEENLKNIDVVIEFSRPESAVENYLTCFKYGKPVVSGTTGWLHRKKEVIENCTANGAGFFYTSNFSLGVNLFFELNKQLAKLMHPFNDYTVSMNEIHHTRKLDAPSGTAITLAEGIMETYKDLTTWKNDKLVNTNELAITSERIGDVPGTHEVFYDSEIDKITIIHEAKNRRGFALGAVLAAEFMKGKKGIYNMSDLLKQ